MSVPCQLVLGHLVWSVLCGTISLQGSCHPWIHLDAGVSSGCLYVDLCVMWHSYCHDDLSTVGPFPPGRDFFSCYGRRGLQVVMLSVLVVRHSEIS